MKLPTIHLNGSAVETLIADNDRALAALRDAFNALAACAPNARDYYPQGPGAFSDAVDGHVARRVRLEAVEQELMAMQEYLYGQQDLRKGGAR